VVDFRLLNKEVVFDAFPMPSVEHAFANFQGAFEAEFSAASSGHACILGMGPGQSKKGQRESS
jgi:hypothetical protein